MKKFTLAQLFLNTWYSQSVIVKDKKDVVLFDGENWKLQSIVYKELLEKFVDSIGVDDGKLIIKIL